MFDGRILIALHLYFRVQHAHLLSQFFGHVVSVLDCSLHLIWWMSVNGFDLMGTFLLEPLFFIISLVCLPCHHCT